MNWHRHLRIGRSLNSQAEKREGVCFRHCMGLSVTPLNPFFILTMYLLLPFKFRSSIIIGIMNGNCVFRDTLIESSSALMYCGWFLIEGIIGLVIVLGVFICVFYSFNSSTKKLKFWISELYVSGLEFNPPNWKMTNLLMRFIYCSPLCHWQVLDSFKLRVQLCQKVDCPAICWSKFCFLALIPTFCVM